MPCAMQETVALLFAASEFSLHLLQLTGCASPLQHIRQASMRNRQIPVFERAIKLADAPIRSVRRGLR